MAARGVGDAGHTARSAHPGGTSGRVRSRCDRARPDADRARERTPSRDLARGVSRIRALLDGTPLATIGLALMREATGRAEPLEVVRPTQPQRLATRARVAFWSLTGGAGASTTAALVAQRSAAAGHAPLLVDLDRWAPSLALRAASEAATIDDALVQPDRERELVSRWSAVPF